MAEELWSSKHKQSIFKQSWPVYDKSKIIDAEVEIPVQVNGKVRAKLLVPMDTTESDAVKLALEDENVKKYVTVAPKKIIFIKGRLINIVI